MPGTVADLFADQQPASTPAPGALPPGFVEVPPPPPGFKVQPAAAAPKRSVVDMLGMGARGLLTGAGGLGDIVLNPVIATANAAYKPIAAITKLAGGTPEADLPYNYLRGAAGAAADAAGLATPETDQEKLANAAVEGGTQGVVTAGAGLAASGARGAAGTVARALAASPATDIVASGTGAASQELARQHGAGPLGQLAAGLIGGVAGVAGARLATRAAESVASAFGPKAAKLVTEVPREVMLDEKGALTEEGQDIAAHNDLHPDQVKAVYDHADEAAQQAVREAQAAEPVGAEPAAAEAAPAPAAEPAAAANDGAQPVVDDPLPATAQARVEQAASEGVPLTKGEATQDFATQEKEQTLLGQPSAEGNAARQFKAQQQERIASALDRFKAAFGDPEATAEERGQLVKDALTSLRDSGKAGVSALYKQARDMATGMGEQAQNLIHLDTAPLLAKLREIFIDEGVPEPVRKALKQQAAKYGLIGDTPKTVEGETTVTLRDSSGEQAGKVTFTGPPQRLTIVNAEDLRQKINQLYAADTSKASQALKPVIDDAVQAAVERAASEGTGDVGKAFGAARAAYVAQQQTFKAKDIVQKLIDWKKGTQTPVVLPEHAIRTIFSGGKEALSNLRKVKAVLLSKPTAKSKAAWQAIQAHGIAQIFDQAMVLNANPGGGALGTISGAKLNTAITKFGADKLKVLLSPEDFNQLMKLRRIIGDATIPIGRTVNHSNSAQKVIQFLAEQGARLASVARIVPGVGHIADVAHGLAKVGKETAEARKTLAGVTDFTPKAAAKADAKAATTNAEPVNYIRRFLSVAGSDEIIAPLIASAANEERP